MDVAGLRWMGVAEEQIAAAQALQAARELAAAEEDDAFGIWEENWPTWQLWLGLASRWQYVQLTVNTPQGVVHQLARQGLPRTEIESAARMRGLPRRQWPQLLADLEGMEQAVLTADRERRARA